MESNPELMDRVMDQMDDELLSYASLASFIYDENIPYSEEATSLERLQEVYSRAVYDINMFQINFYHGKVNIEGEIPSSARKVAYTELVGVLRDVVEGVYDRLSRKLLNAEEAKKK